MSRLGYGSVVLILFVASLVACSTYRADLDRAEKHYSANEYLEALVLLELLSDDLDSLSPAERAQYAYFRGMTYFRLEQLDRARHWLALSAAYEKQLSGSLAPDELTRVNDTLNELNKPWYGIATLPKVDGKKCQKDSDCAAGQFCDNSRCTAAPTEVPSSKGLGTMPPSPTAPAIEPANK